ncbi:MAG: hypothetical protein K8R99_07980 [Actinomycetia bacterium]|nr:hypothetical protein [Actinomycetes bacterium]
MRATRDQGERVQIDLIDVDPVAFHDGELGDEGHAHSRARWRQSLTGVAVVCVFVGAAVAWWPKSHPPEWRVFHAAPVPVAGLNEKLVFDQPPGAFVNADLPPAPVDVKPQLGYVFGEPGGTKLTRRWAAFRTATTSSDDAPVATDAPQVGGVAAVVKRVRVRHEVTWGPIAGRTWTVTTNMLDEAQSLEFANHVAVIDGNPALAYKYQLAGMQPVGSVAALDCVELLTDLFGGERGRGAAQPTLLTWGTVDESVSLGSIAAPSDALPLVEFVLGAGRPITIHGLAATVITSRVLAGPVVAWVEDGRLIMIAGDATSEELIALAESVRPATDEEWQAISDADVATISGFIQVDFGAATPLYQVVDPATGDTLAVTVQVVDPSSASNLMLVCIQQRSEVGTSHCETSSTELPLLTVIESYGYKFVVAMVDRNSNGSEVRITLADGTSTLPVQDFGSGLPGLAVAMLLPTDYGVIELWDNGEVVAAI